VAIYGNIKYHANLRELLREELIQFEDFYRSSVDKSKEEGEESHGLTRAEYDKILADANSDRAYLGFVHIFALSNILKRPIILYAGSGDMQNWGIHEEGVAGTFLPTRHGASECSAKSIALGWSNSHKNHYVPICPTESCDENWEWPKIDIVFKKTLGTETVEQYFSYANLSNERKKFFLIVAEVSKRKPENKITNDHHNISISYSYEDDPYETAKKLIGLIPDAPVDYIAAQLTQKRELMLATKGLKKVSPIRRKDSKILSSIPLDYIITTMPPNNNPKGVLKKILQFNEEIIIKFKNPTGSLHKQGKYLLTERDKTLLDSLFNVLQPSKSSSSIAFDCESLDIVLHLLSWPLEYIWPVIDLIRVLILQEPAAVYYSRMKDGHVSLITLLLTILKVPNINGICLQLCLKLMINLFSHKCFHLSLIMESNIIITQLSSIISQLNFNNESDPKVALCCAQIFLNYSLLLQNGPPYRPQNHYKTIKILINSASSMLKNDRVSDEQKGLFLVTLGTIIQNDAKIIVSNKQFEPFLQSQNAKLREYAKHIIECLNSNSVPLLAEGNN
jgi:hypothetical protein